MRAALRAARLVLAALAAGGCMQARFTPPVENTFRWQLPTEPDTLDPARSSDVNSHRIITQVFEGLVRVTPDNVLEPALAERWDISDDRRVYTFHLRRGVKFHNGREVTADDFAYSINRALADNESPVASSYLNDIVGARAVLEDHTDAAQGIRVLDTYTLEITIDGPKEYFLAKMGYSTAFVVAREEIEAGGDRWTEARLVGGAPQTHCIGTGPFRVAEWRPNERVLLQAFDDYWGGRPRIDWVEFRVVADLETRLSRYQANEADTTDVTANQFDRFRDDPVLGPELMMFPRVSIQYLALNQLRFEPFRDRRVRQAFAFAIDQQQVTEVVLFNIYPPAEAILPPGMPAYEEDYTGIPYDPERARALLAEAGFTADRPLPPLTLTYPTIATDLARVAPVLAEMLTTSLGIEVKLHRTDWNTFLSDMQNKRLEAWLVGWNADYIDPQDFLSIMLHSTSDYNRTGYNNPEYDRLCDAADIEADPGRRMRLYAQANRLVAEDAPWVPLYFPGEPRLVKSRVRGLESNLMAFVPFVRLELVN